jgi:hypothetical protein
VPLAAKPYGSREADKVKYRLGGLVGAEEEVVDVRVGEGGEGCWLSLSDSGNCPSGDVASRQEVRHVLLVSAAEDALSGRSLAVSAGGKLEPVSGRESVVDEFADVITKGARELAR